MEFLPEWVRVQERPWSWGKENNNQQQGTRRAEQQGRVANFMSERERGLVAAVLSLLARSAFPTASSTYFSTIVLAGSMRALAAPRRSQPADYPD